MKRLVKLPFRAVLGLLILFGILAVSVAIELVSPFDPMKPDLAASFQGPSGEHWLGTDQLGRDVLARLAMGARYTIGITVGATAGGSLVGGVFGVLAAYYGGWVETVVMRIVDTLLAFPGVLIAFLVIAVLGTSTGSLVYATIIYSIPVFARLAFGTSKTVLASHFIEAARIRGASDSRIITTHVVPNILPEMVVLWTLRLAIAAMLVSSLSFLGLGVQPPLPEWGAMLSQGREFITSHPAMVVVPGLAVSLLVIGVNLLGDGLRDAVDPRHQV
jgi:peptide/nickel transport system permease protein